MHLEVLHQGETPWELRHFRYEVYVKELKRRQKYANHNDQTITDPLDSFSTNVVARIGNRIVACVRASLCRDGDIGYYKSFYKIGDYFSSLDEITISTQLMIHKDYRKYKAAKLLIEKVYEFVLVSGMKFCFIDCNEPLEYMFQKFGFRTLFKDTHHEYGLVNVMIIELNDIDYFNSIRSPFAKVYQRVHEEAYF